MKTPSKTPSPLPPLPPVRAAFTAPGQAIRALEITCFLLAAVLLVSCQATAPPVARPSAPRSDHWVKVASHPPTYYPRGVPADAPNGPGDGEWVFTGDEQGTVFYLPLRNHGKVPRDVLLAEARSARSKKRLQEIARRDRELQMEAVVGATFGLPLLFGIALVETNSIPYTR